MNQAEHNNNDELTTDQVAQFLTKYPDFFQQFPDLLLMMKLSDHPQGSISLVERQLQGLRQRNRDIGEELHQVMRNAHDNQQLLQQTIELALALIQCNDIGTLTETLYKQLQKLFDIPYNRLLLDKALFSEVIAESIDMASVREVLGSNFPKKQPVCGRLKKSEKKAIFSKSVPVNSVALLPLGEKGELGLLVLGDEDPTHFDPEMGDLFLLLIADILSRLLYRFS